MQADEPMSFSQKPAPGLPAVFRWRPRLKETGLVGVLAVLGLLLTLFGGSLRITDRQSGNVTTVNKFLRADNLDKLAKNTSIITNMAVGATFVIQTGGIDLSVGSIYCLAAVCGAMFLHYFGPGGPGAGASSACVVPAAVVVCVGTGALCGLLNGMGEGYLRLFLFVFL